MILCSYLGKPDVTKVVTISVEAGDPCARYAITYTDRSPCLISRRNPHTGRWRDLWRSPRTIGTGKLKTIAHDAWDLCVSQQREVSK